MTLTVTDLFCGAGGSSQGAEEAGGRLALGLNHWRRAIDTHATNFPHADHDCADVSVCDPRYYPTSDLLIASPECFPAGTLILTETGLRPIESVQLGERVLTHAGRWRPVTATMRQHADTVVVAGEGHSRLETTAEHPFWARPSARRWNQADRQYRRTIGEPAWTPARDLVGDRRYWATPAEFGTELPVPPVGGRGAEFRAEFWWLVGRWLGDGTVRLRPYQPGSQRRDRRPYRAGPAPCVNCGRPARPHRRYPHLVSLWCGSECKAAEENARMLTHAKGSEVQIVCGKHEADELESKLGYAGPVGLRAQAGELRWRRRTLRTAVVFSCGHNGLVEWLMEHFGRYAHGKRLPAWALTMPEPWRRAMLEGYISADGNIGRRTRISTVSKALAVGIRLLASSLGHTASLEALSSRGGQIEGRSIRTRPGWAVSWTTSPVYPHGTRIGQHHWSPVRQVHPGQQGVEVYNLAVAEDESYVADGIVVHNCTAHSYANGVSRKLARRTLFEQPDPAAERSRATMWDVVRFMEAHRYQAVIVENVVNVRDWELFEPWLHAVRSVRPGYEAETVYLNSMVAWPTPQSRDRLYTVIWRKGAPRPRLRFDAPAWCPTCQAVVTGVQSWKNPRRPWGRYAQQYWYRCPACTQITWPLVYPAATAIDWSLKAPRIGDRAKPLAANTIARIQAGLRRYAAQPVPMLVRVAGHTFQREGSTCRVRPVHQPFRAQTGTLADALVIPVNGHVADQGCTGRRARRVAEPLATLTADKALALILSARGTDHNDADHRTRPVSDPLPTQGASKTMALLVTAGGSWQGASPASDPAPTQTAREAWGLLVPTEARAGLRARPADEPMRTQTTRAELGLAMLPIVVEARRNATGRAVDEPLGCVTAKGNHHYLAVPPGFLVANYGDGTDPHKNGWVHGVDQPTGSITTKDHHALLVPYNRTGNPRRPSEPLRTVTTHDREALIDLAERVEDCGFRMLQPAEIQAAMAFRDGYVVLGNKREKVAQLGNAVTPPVMRLLMHRVLESLEGAA